MRALNVEKFQTEACTVKRTIAPQFNYEIDMFTEFIRCSVRVPITVFLIKYSINVS